jgi:hypothetical protein
VNAGDLKLTVQIRARVRLALCLLWTLERVPMPVAWRLALARRVVGLARFETRIAGGRWVRSGIVGT